MDILRLRVLRSGACCSMLRFPSHNARARNKGIHTIRPDRPTTPSKRGQAELLLCSGRCAPRMSVVMLLTLVVLERMVGRRLSVCLSIYRGRTGAGGDGRCSGRALTCVRGCVDAAADHSRQKTPLRNPAQSVGARRRGKRRSGSLTRSSSSFMQPERERGTEGRREWLPASLAGCSVCLFPSLPHRTARRMQQHIYQNPNIISTPLRSCDDDERQTDRRTDV